MSDSNGACLAKVRTRLRDSSQPMVQIARFILKSPAEARNMSIASLAVACGVSTASVSRFSKKLGYAGFKQFQLDLATAVAQSSAVTLEDLSRGTAPESIVQRVFEYNRQSLAETGRVLDMKTLIQVARRIRQSEHTFLMGVGSSALAARYGAMRLLSLGITAIALEDPYTQIFATENVGRGDVVIGISHTGQTCHVIEGITKAAQHGAYVVALTNYPQSPLAVASAYSLITAYREHRISAAVSESIIAQLLVLDSLYFILGSWSGSHAKRLADEVERRTQHMLRLHEGHRRGQP
ncbi:MAG: MurR/RpiR family transcriptional regulator [Bryobacteraceae bacterium]